MPPPSSTKQKLGVLHVSMVLCELGGWKSVEDVLMAIRSSVYLGITLIVNGTAKHSHVTIVKPSLHTPQSPMCSIRTGILGKMQRGNTAPVFLSLS